MWVTIVGHWLVSLPLIVLFTGVLGWGLDGVWTAMFLQSSCGRLLPLRASGDATTPGLRQHDQF